jgi:hypothetical protein
MDAKYGTPHDRCMTSVAAAGPEGSYRDGLYAERKGGRPKYVAGEEDCKEGHLRNTDAGCKYVGSCSAPPKASSREKFETNFDAAGPNGDFKQDVWILLKSESKAHVERSSRNTVMAVDTGLLCRSLSSKEDEVRAPEVFHSPLKHRAIV